MSEDPIICYCFGITRAVVREHFAAPGARLDGLVRATSITTKCTACALDLDVMLDDLHTRERLGTPVSSGKGQTERGFKEIVERVDSGFFICGDKVQTRLRLANYPPNFNAPELCTPHRYQLKVMSEDGSQWGGLKGRVAVNEETTIEINRLPDCPERGWFLLRLIPEGSGCYGSMRPQAVLMGDGWAASYHTQFHTDASRDGRRSGTPLRAVNGRTHAIISIINGATRPTGLVMTLENGPSSQTVERRLAGNGACLIDVDDLFSNLPSDGPVTLRMRSDRPTRKNLINCHPDGSLGVDHFPNVA